MWSVQNWCLACSNIYLSVHYFVAFIIILLIGSFPKIFLFLYRNYFMIVAWYRPWVTNPKHKSYPLQRILTLRPLARDSKSNKQTKAEKVWRFLRENSGLIWQVGDRFLGRLPCQCDSHFCLKSKRYYCLCCTKMPTIRGYSWLFHGPPPQFKKKCWCL